MLPCPQKAQYKKDEETLEIASGKDTMLGKQGHCSPPAKYKTSLYKGGSFAS